MVFKYKPLHASSHLQFAFSGANLQNQFTDGCISRFVLMGIGTCNSDIVPRPQKLSETGNITRWRLNGTAHIWTIKKIGDCLFSVPDKKHYGHQAHANTSHNHTKLPHTTCYFRQMMQYFLKCALWTNPNFFFFNISHSNRLN